MRAFYSEWTVSTGGEQYSLVNNIRGDSIHSYTELKVTFGVFTYSLKLFRY